MASNQTDMCTAADPVTGPASPLSLVPALRGAPAGAAVTSELVPGVTGQLA